MDAESWDSHKMHLGTPDGVVDLETTLNCSALNIIWNLVAGRRYQYDDPEMKKRVRVACKCIMKTLKTYLMHFSR